MTYNLNSFILSTGEDENGLASLAATNKGSNFTVIYGPELTVTHIFPDLLDQQVENAADYINLLLDMVYCIANMPLPGKAYEEIMAVLNKYNKVRDTLPDDLSDDELEQDLALAHAAEDVNTEDKINQLAQQAQQEYEKNTTTTVNSQH